MWGTLLADLVIQMLETDYARILRAIYAFAQVLLFLHQSLHLFCSKISLTRFNEFKRIVLFCRFGSPGHTGYLVNEVTVCFLNLSVPTNYVGKQCFSHSYNSLVVEIKLDVTRVDREWSRELSVLRNNILEPWKHVLQILKKSDSLVVTSG